MSTVMVGQDMCLGTWQRQTWYPKATLSLYLCCPGGSLSDAIAEKKRQGLPFVEPELRDLLLQVSMGLKYIHSSGLVHLDIKPSESQMHVQTQGHKPNVMESIF